jgi:hypothetical protein
LIPSTSRRTTSAACCASRCRSVRWPADGRPGSSNALFASSMT